MPYPDTQPKAALKGGTMQLWGSLGLKGFVRISLLISLVGTSLKRPLTLPSGPGLQSGPPGTTGREDLWAQEGAGHSPGGTKLNAAAEGHRGV